jgi:hypothetical protein
MSGLVAIATAGTAAVPNRRSRFRGMTLVEMLVSMAVTLLLIGLVAQLFGMLGTSVSSSRAIVETTDQLRSVAHKLRTDLAGITVTAIPPSRPDAAAGYLEIIEGDDNDYATDYKAASPAMTPYGDCDDSLLFTTASQGDPFVGRFAGTSTIESPTAEVAWFCVASGTVQGVPLFSLYRRQLLVTSLVGAGAFDSSDSNSNSIQGSLPSAYVEYDLSLRAEGGRLFPNSLADLCKRENRFLNRGNVFPYRLFSSLSGTTGLVFDASSGRQGEDLLLTNVIGFDVRVFDPYAEMKLLNGMVVTPGDPLYTSGSATNPRTFGAYVDLGANVSTATTAIGTPTLSGSMQAKSGLNGGVKINMVYDTWSLHYEFNGIDDDNNGDVDEGSDGEDHPTKGILGIVDDDGERETAPPYPQALRGIEVRIRCYEPSSRQVRQVTVRHTFVPH